MDAKGDIEIDVMFDLREMVRWTFRETFEMDVIFVLRETVRRTSHLF